ncbi:MULTISPECIES: hypothetical protein [Bosea]|uniref:DUF6894 family protein n=1 Tax=Bosea TaxID=85413 RepID=UPI00215052BF|nr:MULTISPECIES: hypothetical protein [Bosea]MCR4522680.1 hypothetical protein [Bosea sp. 47.2.35]MDR6827189.1 hypothetical protein [Bosea robiniae]MDR6893899.1 hypothetical protein [Bosea sp. BE109]MDR7136401.1 hypothetical protein [Bosea sp. BE168]MDR7173100.1 hypothetical protein [Bosea sp. BE271]
MPSYFFHTRDGEKLEIDEEGTDLPDDQSARNAAKELLTALNREKLPNGDHMSLSVTVKNAEGAEIYIASLRLDGLPPSTRAGKS